jgi:hypothetical protein
MVRWRCDRVTDRVRNDRPIPQTWIAPVPDIAKSAGRKSLHLPGLNRTARTLLDGRDSALGLRGRRIVRVVVHFPS